MITDIVVDGILTHDPVKLTNVENERYTPVEPNIIRVLNPQEGDLFWIRTTDRKGYGTGALTHGRVYRDGEWVGWLARDYGIFQLIPSQQRYRYEITLLDGKVLVVRDWTHALAEFLGGQLTAHELEVSELQEDLCALRYQKDQEIDDLNRKVGWLQGIMKAAAEALLETRRFVKSAKIGNVREALQKASRD